MRVLFLTHRVPYAPNRGDRVRAFHIVRLLAASVDLEIVSLAHDRAEIEAAKNLQAAGVRVHVVKVPRLRTYARAIAGLAGDAPLTHVLLDAPRIGATFREIVRRRPPAVVLAYCSSMARFALAPPLSDFPLVVDMVDVDSEKWSAFARSAGTLRGWIYRREARCLARFERQAVAQAHATLVVNEREARALRRLEPRAAIHIVPVGADRSLLPPPGRSCRRPVVVFCGVMNYAPNVEGVRWFAREIWPRVLRLRPEAEFRIVGSNPTRQVRRLAGLAGGIVVTGAVPDVREHLWEAAVSVAPLLTARGVQTKVLEAVAAGAPPVVTPQVADGLPDAVLPACRIAAAPDAFAADVVALLGLADHERCALIGRVDMRRLSWEEQLAPLPLLLADAAAASGGAAGRLDASTTARSGILTTAWRLRRDEARGPEAEHDAAGADERIGHVG